MLAALRNERNRVIGWFVVAFILGASFIALELNEFTHLVQEGNSWTRSAFLSSFFTLVGTHGLHVSIGLLWMIVMMVQVFMCGITCRYLSKTCRFQPILAFLGFDLDFHFYICLLDGSNLTCMMILV